MESINQNLEITNKKLRFLEEKINSQKQIIENLTEKKENPLNINK